MCYLAYLSTFADQEVNPDYTVAVVEGAGDFLHHHHGRLKPSKGWVPPAPEPRENDLASHLLALLELHPWLLEKGNTGSRLVSACALVLHAPEDVARLTNKLERLRHHPEPGVKPLEEQSDLRNDSFNTTRGIAAQATLDLAIGVLETGVGLPEPLVDLLFAYARDPVHSVRTGILFMLPVFTAKLPELGRRLFDAIMDGASSPLWEEAEMLLYYQYVSQFEWVSIRLARMRTEGGAKALAGWGRISALAVLAGHISLEELFDSLHATVQERAWLGAAQVFAANAQDEQSGAVCVAGMRRIGKEGPRSREINIEVDKLFKVFVPFPTRIDDADSLELLQSLVKSEEYRDDSMIAWLSALADLDPHRAMPLCEALATCMEGDQRSSIHWNTKPLFAALTSILRTADALDDKDFIARAIALQDRFLQMFLDGFDEMLTQAEKV